MCSSYSMSWCVKLIQNVQMQQNHMACLHTPCTLSLALACPPKLGSKWCAVPCHAHFPVCCANKCAAIRGTLGNLTLGGSIMLPIHRIQLSASVDQLVCPG